MTERRRPQQKEYILYAGERLSVEFYYRSDGVVPVFEFYRSRRVGERQRLIRLAMHLADAPPGLHLPRTLFNLEDANEQIYALKPRAARYVGAFAAPGRFIIFDAYEKQTQRLGHRERRHLGTAIARKRDFEERMKRGTYYA